MKSNSIAVGSQARFAKTASLAFVVCAILLSNPRGAAAQTTYYWFNSSGGGQTWSVAGNWFNGIADGANNTADFSEITYSGDTTLHLDSPRTIGNLLFGNSINDFNFAIDNNGSSANTLTFSVSSGTPTITVASGTAAIGVALTGNQGLNVAGSGTLLLTADNTVTGSLSMAGGETLILAGNNIFTNSIAVPVQGTLVLGGSNSFTGAATIASGGVLNISSDPALGATTNITFSGNATLQFAGSMALSSGRSLGINASATATLDTAGNSVTYGGVISGGSGSSGLTIVSVAATGGTLTLNGAAANSYSGATAINSGTLALDLGNLPTPTNLINPVSALALGGGTLAIKDKLGITATSQTFSSTTINAGASAITINVNGNTNGASTLALGAITRNLGGTLNFDLPAVGSVTTTNSNIDGMLGPWATVGGADWAAVDGSGHITTFTAAGGAYTPNVWASGNNTTITASSDFSGLNTGLVTNSVLFNAPGGNTVLLPTASAGPNHAEGLVPNLPTITSTLASGGILMTPNVGPAVVTIGIGSTGGAAILSAGNPQNDFVINQFDSLGTLVIGAYLGSNGSPVSLTKNGPGTVILAAGANAYASLYENPTGYSGNTFINQGLLSVAGVSLGASGNTTFAGNGRLQVSDIVNLGENIIISPGARAIIDNNSVLGPSSFNFGDSTSDLSGTITGPGDLVYMASTGNTNSFVAMTIYGVQRTTPIATYTGPTTVYVGTLQLLFQTDPNNHTSTYYTPMNVNNVLNLGGTIAIQNFTFFPNSVFETLATYVNLIADTSSQFTGDTAGGLFQINSSFAHGIVRNTGATLNIDSMTAVDVGNRAVPMTNGIIGGWATYGGADWASLVANGGGAIGALPAASYTSDAWSSANNTTVTHNDNFSPAGANLPNLTTNSLRFVSLTTASGNPLSQTVTLSGTNVIGSGGILVTTSGSVRTIGTQNSTFTIAGGNLTSGNGTDLIVNQFNLLAGSSLTISSAIVNNGATPIGLTLGGNTLGAGGTLILANPNNSFTGATVINAATILRAGAANVIPATSPVILSMLGTLDLNGFSQSIGSLANTTQGLATLAGASYGYGTTVVANGVATLTVGNDNTSTTFNGSLKDGTGKLSLVKIGSGTLTLGNYSDNVLIGTPNLSTYSGGTAINGGVIAIPFDGGLGAVPGVATPANLVINGTTTNPSALQALSTFTLSSNRGIALGSSAAGTGGTIDVTAGNSLIYGGSIANNGGVNGLTVNGLPGDLGTLHLSGTSTFTGPTTVNAGKLELAVASNNNLSASAAIDIKNGATLDVTQVTGPGGFILAAGQTLKGKGTILGGVTVAGGSHLDPGESVGTLTGDGLTLLPGGILDFEFNGTSNDFFSTLSNNGLNINGGGFNLYQEGTLTPFDTPGIYHVLGYAGSLQGTGLPALSVLNPQSGFTYSFSNNLGLNDVDLTIAAVPEPSSLVLAALGLAGLGLFPRRRIRY